jgi:hypothetical protein
MTTHGPVRFREREASRAIRAAQKAGLRVDRIEVSADGRLGLVTSRDNQEAAPEINEWDRPRGKAALCP